MFISIAVLLFDVSKLGDAFVPVLDVGALFAATVDVDSLLVGAVFVELDISLLVPLEPGALVVTSGDGEVLVGGTLSAFCPHEQSVAISKMVREMAAILYRRFIRGTSYESMILSQYINFLHDIHTPD